MKKVTSPPSKPLVLAEMLFVVNNKSQNYSVFIELKIAVNIYLQNVSPMSNLIIRQSRHWIN